MTWRPTSELEEAILGLQPDHDFIFGTLTDLANKESGNLREQERNKHENKLTRAQGPKLDMIGKVQRIAGTKPLGHQPTINDWEDDEHIEQETIALMRHFGFGPNTEGPLYETAAKSTYPEMKMNIKGKKEMPIYFDEKFFKLKPRQENMSLSPDDQSKSKLPNFSNVQNSMCSKEKVDSTNCAQSKEHHYAKCKENFSSKPKKLAIGFSNNHLEKDSCKQNFSSQSKTVQKFYTPRELYEMQRYKN